MRIFIFQTQPSSDNLLTLATSEYSPVTVCHAKECLGRCDQVFKGLSQASLPRARIIKLYMFFSTRPFTQLTFLGSQKGSLGKAQHGAQ